MRRLTIAALAILLLGSAAPLVWAQDEEAAPSKAAPPADEVNKGDQAKDDQKTEADDEDKEEFHLDLRDVKDLRDADIRLPELDEEPAAQPVEPEGPEPQPAEKPDEPDLKIEKPPEAEPEEPEVDPRELVREILDGMDDSAERLSERKDTGEETQGVQKKVVDDLSKLIKYVAQQQQQSSSSQSQQNQRSRRDSQQAQRGQGPQGSRSQQGRGQRQGRRSQRPMQDEMATKGSVQEEERENLSKRLEDRWGDLLKNAPRETRQAIPSMILEKYRDLLGRYFYALARQAAEKREEP